MKRSDTGTTGHWKISDIPYDSVDVQRARSDPYLLYLVAGASFVEITSDLYANNLVEYFAEDEKFSAWIAQHWESEEAQHGQALRRYVETVWPEFDWERAYAAFVEEYSTYCEVDQLGPTRALELVSRCVVETGTTTFYTSLAQASPEPVLAQIASRIKEDEQRHYNLFLYHYRRWADSEGTGRRAVLGNLGARLREVGDEDIYCAIKHVFQTLYPQRRFTPDEYRRIRRHYSRLARRYYPYRQAIRMLLKPLQLNRVVSALATPVLAAAGWLFVA